MTNTVQKIDGLSQWVSLGWETHNPDFNREENRHWYGSFHSPQSSGGNFLVYGYWDSEDCAADISEKVQAALKVWDHQFLHSEDLRSDGRVLTPEVLAQRLFRELQGQLAHKLKFCELQLSKNHRLLINAQSDLISHFHGFRLRSILTHGSLEFSQDWQGVDAQIWLEFQGSQVVASPWTLVPQGELEEWLQCLLPSILAEQALDQWLGIALLEELPLGLYHRLQEKFSHLVGVEAIIDSLSLGYSTGVCLKSLR